MQEGGLGGVGLDHHGLDPAERKPLDELVHYVVVCAGDDVSAQVRSHPSADLVFSSELSRWLRTKLAIVPMAPFIAGHP